MDIRLLDEKILTRGREFFASISGEAPGIFNKGWWTGKVMDWAMKNQDFKVQLFRFVDVLPSITTSDSLSRHIQEYFGDKGADIPEVLKWGAGKTGFAGGLVAKMLNLTIRSNIEAMARQFIIGEKASEAVKGLKKLRKDGFAFVLDLLGEATVSEGEAQAYHDGYMEVLGAIHKELDKWEPLAPVAGDLDWGHAPRVNVAVKPSAFYSQAKPQDFEGSVAGMQAMIEPIFRKVKAMGGFLCLDMEQTRYKDMTLELYRRLRAAPEHRDYPHLGVVLQAYLKSTDRDLDGLLAFARREGLPISVRLVKGAYWDFETVHARQNGLDIPVYTHKPESDLAFERLAKTILANQDICHFACASHNIRTISAVMELAKALNVPDERYEFQVLYGMAEPVRKGLRKVAGRVRLYCPYGDLLPGMAYLVRRLLENTANESFLKQSFADGTEVDRLMENPQASLDRELAARTAKTKAKTEATTGAKTEVGSAASTAPGSPPPFRNHPMADFSIEAQRTAFVRALAQARAALGRIYPLFIGGREVVTDLRLDSVNPAAPSEVVGSVCQAGQAEAEQAMAEAKKAFAPWRDTPAKDRAAVLFKAADIARKRFYQLCAVQVLEVGKQWDQAHGDVAEAIDFLEYYGREILRLAQPRRMGHAPGEMNQYFYQAKGVAVVIAPWNFPLAISLGMSAAAIAAGCPVVYKPAGPSSVVGFGLVELFREAGLPDGVFNYLPGPGSTIGDLLVDHPGTAVIAFTGSMEVGLRIQERAARVWPGQTQCKKVIAEMGGKNAIIVDEDADLDETVPGVLASAFAFQGQKCSACSRVIVLDAVYDRFVNRLVNAARCLKIGPAEDPAHFMGPLVDVKAQAAILKYIDLAATEGQILYKSEVPATGCYAPLTIVAGITPDMRLAREEIFGPVLSILRAKDFAQAVDLANDSAFALTGAVYSRSPANLDKARRDFRVGNLYLNRGSTGAQVERQPFGGFKMSGVGSKAGGPDYLLQFLDPRVVTENTMRRGFAPVEQDDEWV